MCRWCGWSVVFWGLACAGGGETPLVAQAPAEPMTLGYDHTEVEVIGWAPDGSAVALRRWLRRGPEHAWAQAPTDCPGYRDVDGAPFDGGLELWLCTGTCRSYRVQSAHECTSETQAAAALARAKGAFAEAQIEPGDPTLSPPDWRLGAWTIGGTGTAGKAEAVGDFGEQRVAWTAALREQGKDWGPDLQGTAAVPAGAQATVRVPLASVAPTGRSLVPLVQVEGGGHSELTPAGIVYINGNDALDRVRPTSSLGDLTWGQQDQAVAAWWSPSGEVLVELALETDCALEGPTWVLVSDVLPIEEYTRPVGPDCTPSEAAIAHLDGHQMFESRGATLEQPLLDLTPLGDLVRDDALHLPGRAPLPLSHTLQSSVHIQTWTIDTLVLSPDGRRALVLGGQTGQGVNGDEGATAWLVALLEKDGDGWRLLREGARPPDLQNPWPLGG